MAECVSLFQAFESTLKSWEDKQKCEFPRTPQAQASLSSQPEVVSEDEAQLISDFGQAAGALIHRWALLSHRLESEKCAVPDLADINRHTTSCLCFSIREVAQSHHSLEQELAHAVNASSKAMDVVYANSKSSGVREVH